jgi:hypothetical protein
MTQTMIPVERVQAQLTDPRVIDSVAQTIRLAEGRVAASTLAEMILKHLADGIIPTTTKE